MGAPPLLLRLLLRVALVRTGNLPARNGVKRPGTLYSRPMPSSVAAAAARTALPDPSDDAAASAATDGRETLHRSVARTLRDEIASGAVPLGALLPGEHELCLRFNVSRHTIREALRQLTQDGLVERRQGSGTRIVSAVPRRGRYMQSMRSLEELRQYAAETELLIRTVKETTLAGLEAEAVSAVPAAHWIRIEALRRGAGGEAICSTTVLVHRRFARLLQDLPSGDGAPGFSGTIYSLVEERSGEPIAGAEQDIAARAMPRAAARALGLRDGAPALLMVRRYLDGAGAPMVCSLNWHPADRFTYRMRLRRDR